MRGLGSIQERLPQVEDHPPTREQLPEAEKGAAGPDPMGVQGLKGSIWKPKNYANLATGRREGFGAAGGENHEGGWDAILCGETV